MPENNLKPCPFCGGEAHRISYPDLYKTECKNLECFGNHGYWTKTREEADRLWNTRSNIDFAKARTSLLKLARKWENEGSILGTSNDFVDKEAARELKECAKQLRKALRESR